VRKNLILNLPIREASIASGIPESEIQEAVNKRLVFSFYAERLDMGYKAIFVNLNSLKNYFRNKTRE